jgi:hypothetical protein
MKTLIHCRFRFITCLRLSTTRVLSCLRPSAIRVQKVWLGPFMTVTSSPSMHGDASCDLRCPAFAADYPGL